MQARRWPDEKSDSLSRGSHALRGWQVEVDHALHWQVAVVDDGSAGTPDVM